MAGIDPYLPCVSIGAEEPEKGFLREGRQLFAE